MSVPRSQRMSIGGLVAWSLLCGVLAVVFAGIAAAVVEWSNEYAFKKLSSEQVGIVVAGIFLLGALLPMVLLLKIKWMEEEGPAEMADEIERKLNG